MKAADGTARFQEPPFFTDDHFITSSASVMAIAGVWR
jgi:hypothetical protein